MLTCLHAQVRIIGVSTLTDWFPHPLAPTALLEAQALVIHTT